jgi:ribonucleoside-diphosphate reductase beta chain
MALLDFSKTYKPFQYPWAVELTKKHEEIHWVEDEAELSEDVQDWRTKLSTGEKEFITHVLRLFTQSDVQVGENYHELLIPKFKNNEIRNMLSSFANREGVHQRAYALLNDTLGLPDEDFHAFLEYKEMSDKIDFMKEGSHTTHTGLALSLAQSVFNEGMSVFASFVMLLNFQRFGKMKGMGTIVEWSIRDETLHVQGNAKLFRTFCEEHSRVVNDELKSKIYQMARNAVKLEDKFIDLAYNMAVTDSERACHRATTCLARFLSSPSALSQKNPPGVKTIYAPGVGARWPMLPVIVTSPNCHAYS